MGQEQDNTADFHFDELSQRFREQWQRGDHPSIASFLKVAAVASRPHLLERLVAIDIELRVGAGQRVVAGDYADLGPVAIRIAGDYLKDNAVQLIPRPAELAGSADAAKTQSSRTIGPYKLLQQIGEGGMGSVWMADQERPVRRRVALKVIKAGMDSQQVIARFEAERQALAMMDHENIAKVLDAGTTDDGRPYFAMELVRGISITKYCDSNSLSIRERLALFISACRAVQHAHQKGIIHRDIKPSNVLVALYDGRPVVKIIDFGLAKALQQKLTERTMFTQYGQVVGTLEYMSPEQAEMNALDVDTRTDVYSLGVLLYELLTGSTPLQRERVRREALDRILLSIREEESPRPSVRLSESGDAIPSISAQRRIEPKKLRELLKGDLDWIVMKALDKDRTRRYDGATALANDVARYLADDVIDARPPSFSYRLRKAYKKYRTRFITVGSISCVLIAGFAGTGMMWRSSLIEARRATAAEANSLLLAEIDAVPDIIKGLKSQRKLNKNSQFVRHLYSLRTDSLPATGRTRVNLALADLDRDARDELFVEILLADAAELRVYASELRAHCQEYLPELWAHLKEAKSGDGKILRAACALAVWDTSNPRWHDVGRRVANQLLNADRADVGAWSQLLEPVGAELTGELREKFESQLESESVRQSAAIALGQLSRQSPRSLVELIGVATETQFEALVTHLELNRTECAAELRKVASESNASLRPGPRANAAVALFVLDDISAAKDFLQTEGDIDLVSYVISRLSWATIDAKLMELLRENQSTFGLQSSLLALGNMQIPERPAELNDVKSVVRKVLGLYRSHPDPGVHGAARWSLEHWRDSRRFEELDRELQLADQELAAWAPVNGCRWFVSPDGHQFTVLGPTAAFQIGDAQPERSYSKEPVLSCRIDREFIIGTNEVTVAQFQVFLDESGLPGPRPSGGEWDLPQDPDSPIVYVPWYWAAAYCNWLSRRSGVPDDQLCYQVAVNREYGPGMKIVPNHVEKTGFRLPTEAEWEYACRAGNDVPRHFGSNRELLSEYAWFIDVSKNRLKRVGMLRPNRYGLFDTLGNAWEWCLESPLTQPIDQIGITKNTALQGIGNEQRVIRGASVFDNPEYVRASVRSAFAPMGNFNIGFRIVRTLKVPRQ